LPLTCAHFPYTTLFRSVCSVYSGQRVTVHVVVPHIAAGQRDARAHVGNGRNLVSDTHLESAKQRLGHHLYSGFVQVNCRILTSRSEEHTSELQSRVDLV